MIYHVCHSLHYIFFFFNDTATTEIYTLSLHDALPIYLLRQGRERVGDDAPPLVEHHEAAGPLARLTRSPRQRTTNKPQDRKSTRLNSSHANISYAVFCLKKKKKNNITVMHTLTSMQRK